MARRSVHQHGLSRAANRQSHSLGRGRRIRPGVWWQGLPVPGGAVGGDRGGDGHVDLVWAVGATAWPQAKRSSSLAAAEFRHASRSSSFNLLVTALRSTGRSFAIRHAAHGWSCASGATGGGGTAELPPVGLAVEGSLHLLSFAAGDYPVDGTITAGRIRAALEVGAKRPTRGAKKVRSTGRELTDDFRFPDRRPARRSGSSEPMGTAIATIVADYGAPIDTVREAAAGRSWHECGTTESPLPETARNLSGRRDSNPRPTAWEALARMATGNDR